jgi:tetratricopeptide (TPR) repeat protein
MKGIPFILLSVCLLCSNVSAQSVLQKYETGISLLRQGKSGEARAVFDEIIAMRPYYYDAWVGRGRAWLMDGLEKAAMEDFDKALELKPGWYEAHYYRALLHYTYDRLKPALSDLEKCLQSEERHGQAWFLKGKIQRDLGQLSSAEAAFTQAIRYGRDDVKAAALAGRARLKHRMGKTGEAIADLSEVLKESRNWDSLYLLRSEWFALQGDTNEAIADLSIYLSRDPSEKEARFKRAGFHFQTGDYAASRKDMDHLINAHPREALADWFELRAEVLMKMQEADAAVGDINKALALDRSREYLYLRRAEAYAASGKDNAALADYRRLIRLGSDDPRPWIGRASYYMKHKRWELALDDLNTAIKVKPTAEAHYQRAICFYELKNDDKACQDLKAAAGMKHLEAQKMSMRFCP